MHVCASLRPSRGLGAAAFSLCKWPESLAIGKCDKRRREEGSTNESRRGTTHKGIQPRRRCRKAALLRRRRRESSTTQQEEQHHHPKEGGEREHHLKGEVSGTTALNGREVGQLFVHKEWMREEAAPRKRGWKASPRREEVPATRVFVPKAISSCSSQKLIISSSPLSFGFFP